MNIKQMTFGQLMDAYELAKMEGDTEAMLAYWGELINRRGARTT